MSLKNGGILELTKWELWFFPALLGGILITISLYDFVVFHTLAELFAIFISLVMFATAWSTDSFTKNKFLMYLACGYFAIGMLDLVHTFVYEGMNFFIEGNSNQASQFWIITRYFEALLLLSAPSFIDRRINKFFLLIAFIAIAIVSFIAIMTGYFPNTFIDGVGLTPFKISSEYIINLILVGAVYRVLKLGDRIGHTTKNLIVLAAILTVAAELMFTFYVDAYDLSNLAGHIFKIFSYWMIFQAIVLSNLQQPYLELQKAHKDIQTSEAKHRSIIDNTSQGYWMIDGGNKTIDVNEALCSMLGYTRDEMIGASPTDFVNAENRKIFIHQHAHKADQRDRRYEIELTSKDGRQISTLFAATTMEVLPDDQPSSFALITDISEQKRVEFELLEHRERLKELVEERTAEVNEKADQLEEALATEKEFNAMQKKFIALVSHEFRTPLAIIDGIGQRLLRHKGDFPLEEVKARVTKIRSAVARMVTQIDTTLYASRLDEGKIEFALLPCDLALVLADVCEEQSEISPDHHIQVVIHDLPAKVSADHELLSQVFSNLLSNAVKYSPAGSHIKVKGWRDGDEAVIALSDEGVGISEADLPHMFERFFRAKTAEGVKGTGIGLSVAKEFVNIHGGTISVDSEEGEGSTFTVRLPIGDGNQ